MIIGTSMEQRTCRIFLDSFHTIYSIKREISRHVHVVRRTTNETTSNIKIWLFVVRNLEEYVKELENEGKAKLDKWKTEAW